MCLLCGKLSHSKLEPDVSTIDVLLAAYFYSCDYRDGDRTQVSTMQVENFPDNAELIPPFFRYRNRTSWLPLGGC